MKALKKVLLAGLALTCLAGPMVQAAPRIINIRDKDFTNIEEPLPSIRRQELKTRYVKMLPSPSKPFTIILVPLNGLI